MQYEIHYFCAEERIKEKNNKRTALATNHCCSFRSVQRANYRVYNYIHAAPSVSDIKTTGERKTFL